MIKNVEALHFLKLSNREPYDSGYPLELYISWVYQSRRKEQFFRIVTHLFASVKINVHGN